MNLLAQLLRRVFRFRTGPGETWAQQWLTHRAVARALQQFRTFGKRRKARSCPRRAWSVDAVRLRIGCSRSSKRR